MKFLIVIFSTVFFGLFAQAQTRKTPPAAQEKGALEKVGDVAKDTTEQVAKAMGETAERRAANDYFILGNYSPIDFILPNKYGVTLGLVRYSDETWEFEYLKGSVSVPFLVKDLGEMTDTRYSIIRRSYFGGNSFNLSYGITYFDFALHLGNDLLNQFSGGAYPDVDLVRIQSLGANVAIGNRWTFKHNITFGVDWISWAQPLFITQKKADFLDYASNSEDKDNVDTATKLISYFPRLAFLKLQLGILF